MSDGSGKKSRYRYMGDCPARGLVRLTDYLQHRRIVLFWAVAVVGLAAPWLVRGLDMPDLLASSEDLRSCEVLSIYDGDTMTVRCQGEKVKVRLYCIDAPEMGQKPWGRESRDYLRQITPERVLVRQVTKDRYGRTVGELFIDAERTRNLGLLMINAGQAVVYERYCSEDEYLYAEKQAKFARLGVWKETGKHQRPWRWRH